jgi:hypothetical protein
MQLHKICLIKQLKGKRMKPETMMIDEVKYVREDMAKEAAPKLGGLDYKIIRTYSAGVFAGYLKSKAGDEVVLVNARRLWYWEGAASLSQLAVDGVSKPSSCKFPCEVAEAVLLGVVEILPVTTRAMETIAAVKIWEE